LTKNLLPVAGQAVFFVNRHNGIGQGAAKRKAMKRNAAFKRACNEGLSGVEGIAVGRDRGSDPSWAAAHAVSRAIVRSVVVNFATAGLIEYNGRRKALLRQFARRRVWRGFDGAASAFSCAPRMLRSILALIVVCGGSSLVTRER
jgi:hypothetical protein